MQIINLRETQKTYEIDGKLPENWYIKFLEDLPEGDVLIESSSYYALLKKTKDDDSLHGKEHFSYARVIIDKSLLNCRTEVKFSTEVEVQCSCDIAREIRPQISVVDLGQIFKNSSENEEEKEENQEKISSLN